MLDRFQTASFPVCFRWLIRFLGLDGTIPLPLSGRLFFALVFVIGVGFHKPVFRKEICFSVQFCFGVSKDDGVWPSNSAHENSERRVGARVPSE